MGRRERTRARSEAARASAAATGGPTGAARPPGSRVLAILNPLKGTSRMRVVWAAVAFAVAGLVLTVVGLVADRPEWYRSAMLLGLLALVWGVRAGFMSDDRQQ